MSTKGKKLGLVAILIGLVTAGAVGVASAKDDQDGPGRGDRKAEMLQKYDANKDGKLDDSEKATMRADRKAEFEAKKQEMLAKYDTNRDGKLDETERAAMRDDRAAARFAKLDTDHDGKLSLAEFKAGAMKMQGRRGFGGGFRHHRGHGHGQGRPDDDGGNSGGGSF